MVNIEWKGKYLTVGETNFAIGFFATTYADDDQLPLIKSREMLERYLEFVEALAPRHIVEIGIAEGGSTAFLNEVARPEKLVALEFEKRPRPRLDAYLDRCGAGSSVSVYTGVNQADGARVREIIDTEFGNTALDLVIDDASHLLEETRRSFNTLFPRLRPGGLFIIEDWPWAHAEVPDREDWAELIAGLPTGKPLTTLVCEILMTLGSKNGIVSEVRADDALVMVRRGPAELDWRTFDIGASYVPSVEPLFATRE